MIGLHYWPTPNGKKVTILLEECGLPYKIVPVNIGRGDQFKDAFLEMNPNHRMPVMVDHEPKDGGKPIVVFESGSIMMYIAEKVGKFWPQDTRTKYEVNEWVIWQMANQGPKSGECGHFRRVDQAAQGDQTYAITRFTDEVNRLYGVLNNRLYKHKYLAGDQYTIADMICYPWTVNWKFQGQDIEEFKHFKRWHEELAARPQIVAVNKIELPGTEESRAAACFELGQHLHRTGHPEDAVLTRLGDQVEGICRANARKCTVTVTETSRSKPVPFTSNIPDIIERAAAGLDYRRMRILSGAGHDAMHLATICPTGMIFVPCENGVSHSEIENATPADLAAGTRVLAAAMVELANA